ncbi:TPA: hypothetical protein ACGY69_002763 [Enterococcus faecalis]
MYNMEKLSRYKKIAFIGGSLLLIVLIFLIGLSVGQRKQVNINEKQVKVEKKEELTTSTVKKFLIAYYTKKDLGENRNRYEPLVTSAMYNELVNVEKQPVNQAYKGYVVNQVLDTYKIYIDTENNEVIVDVTYKNTQRTKRNNDEGALKNQSNQEALKLTFVKQGANFLVDKMAPVTLTNELQEEPNSYNTHVVTTEESTKESANSGEK